MYIVEAGSLSLEKFQLVSTLFARTTNMPDIKLYRKDGSCSMASHILLRELKIPFTAIELQAGPNGYEAADGSFSHGEYLNIHPSGYVPALSVDGTVITENPAILRYIADQVPERGLLGSRPMDPYRVQEWLVWLSASLHAAGFGALWRPARFADDENAHPAIVRKGRAKILDCFERIEGRIEGSFAVGDSLTVVDIYLHTFWRWGVGIGLDTEQYPRYRELARRVEAMEMVKTVMAEEGQSLTVA